MPRYFFHLVGKAGTILDVEGTDLPDLDRARSEAIRDARNLMSDAMREGRDISSRRIHICDADAKILLEVPFFQALTRDD